MLLLSLCFLVNIFFFCTSSLKETNFLYSFGCPKASPQAEGTMLQNEIAFLKNGATLHLN
jgi:hypothetical protein